MRLHLERNALIPSLLLAAQLTTGLLVGWMMLYGIGVLVFAALFPNNATQPQLEFTFDGEPLVRTYAPGDRSLLEPIYRDLQGKRIDDPLRHEGNSAGPLPSSKDRPRRSGGNWGMQIWGFLQRQPMRAFWYLIYDDNPPGSTYFVGYQTQSRQLVGYLGRSGFTHSTPEGDDRFQIPFNRFQTGSLAPSSSNRRSEPTRSPLNWNKLYLVSGTELLAIDFEQQSVEPVAMPGEVISVGHYSELHQGDENDTLRRLVVRLPRELQILSADGQPQRTVPISAEMQSETLEILSLTDGRLIVIAYPPDNYWAPRQLYWFGAEGNVLRHEVADIYGPRTADDPNMKWFVTTLTPVPLALSFGAVKSATERVRSGASRDFLTAYRDIANRYWLAFTLLSLISLGLAVYAFRHQKQFDSASAIAWAVFVFLLGPAGLLGYLLHRQWPTRTACSQCGKWVPRDRSACLACREEFSSPALLGIEIFA